MLAKCKIGGGVKNRAFTLIELLGVVIILGILALVIYPILTKTIKNQERKTFELSIQGLISVVLQDMATDDSITPRYYHYDYGKLYLLLAGDQEQSERIKVDGNFKGSGNIFVDLDGHVFVESICDKKYCAYHLNDSETLVVEKNMGREYPKLDLDSPMISLKGSEQMILHVSERYIEPGFVAKTKRGMDLTEDVIIKIMQNGKVVDGIDTSEVGNFVILYEVSSHQETVVAKRTVTVTDQKPVITITSPDTHYVKSKMVEIGIQSPVGNTVNNFIYRINDGNEITVTGTSKTITFDQTGKYTISVEVTDSQGNKETKTGGVYKIDTIPPLLTVPDSVSLKADSVSGYDFEEGVQATDEHSSVSVRVEGTVEAIPGDYVLTYIATDEAGNQTRKTRVITVLETDAPIINLSSNGTDGWASSVVLTMAASDNNGVKAFTYQIEKDGILGEVVAVTEENFMKTITFQSNGIYKVYLTATDTYDNTSILISREYRIDTVVPDITFQVGGQVVTGTRVNDDSIYAGYYLGCFNGTQTIEAIPSDNGGSGVNRMETLMKQPNLSWDNRTAYDGNSISYTMNTEGFWDLHTQVWDYASNVKGGISSADNWLRTSVYIDMSAGTLTVNTNGYTVGSVVSNDVSFTLTGTNGGCESSKNYYYSINNGDWIYLGSGDSVTYSSTSFTANTITKDYVVKFLITDGWGRWGQITDNYAIKVYKDIQITFDSASDLDYFHIYDSNSKTGGSVVVDSGYAVQSTTVTDAGKSMQLSPSTFGRSDFTYVEWRSRRETTNTSCQFPFLTIHFSDGLEFRYFMMNTFTFGYSSWAYTNLKENTGNAMWQLSSANMYDTSIDNPTTKKYGILGETSLYSVDTTYSITIDKQTGQFTIYDGHLNKTVTTEALTTATITNIDFNFQDDWYNRNTVSYIDYIKIR